MSRPTSVAAAQALSDALLGLSTDKSHHEKDKFCNPWPSYVNNGGLVSFFKMVALDWDRKRSVPVPVPATTVNRTALESPPHHAPQLTWLGHACFLLQVKGVSVLTDPIFSDRCSPVQFAGPKRFMPAPLAVPSLPKVDVVIISHNHYDHLDSSTIKELANRFPDAVWCVPLGNAELIKSFGATHVTELDWWGETVINIPIKAESIEEVPPKAGTRSLSTIRAVCTPCQHFSGRSLTDRMKTLWASWSLFVTDDVSPQPFRFFFGGDTGYRTVPRGFVDAPGARETLPACPVFRTIGEVLGPFDLAALPIGAYSPRWFMSSIHCDPFDAVEVHRDIRSRFSVGMHWGTFVLTDEPVLEPPKLLAEALARRDVPLDQFVTLRHGESITVPFEREATSETQAVSEVIPIDAASGV